MSKQATAQKLVPKLRFPEFQNAGAWEEINLKKVFSIFQGFAFSSNDAVKEGSRWLKIAGVSIQKINHNNSSFLPIEYKEKYKKFLVEQGDYVIALTRPILNKQLKVAPVDRTYHNSLLNQRVGKIVSNQNIDFIYLLLQTSKLINDIEKNISGSEPPNLSTYQIQEIRTYIPLKKEQQKIADCLSSLDDLITTQTKKLTALQQHKKGLMQTLFPADGKTCPKLRFPEFSDKWGNKKIGDIATLKKGSGLSKSKLSKHGKYKCILYGELFTTYNETINKVKSRTDFNEGVHSIVGDVLLPASTTTTAIDLANTTLVNENNILLGGDINIIRPIDKYDVDSMFLTYILAYNKKRSIAKLAQGVTIIHLYGSSLEKLIISIPKPKEQQKIADCLSSLDNLITTQTQKLTALQQHKKGLMQNLFPSN